MATKALQDNEVKKLKVAAKIGRNPERDWCLIALCLSGLRVAEPTKILNRDILNEDGSIRQTFTLRGKDVKNGRNRLCYLTPGALKAAEDYVKVKRSLEPERPFIESQVNIHNKMAPNTAARIVKQHMVSAGIESSSHALRKYCATTLRKNGADILLISRVLSHKDVRTTMIYLSMDELEVENAMKALKY